jgi:hypothetical protein
MSHELERNSHTGRPRSWAAVAIMLIGFLTAGLALPLGPIWPMFWTGAGIVIVGGIIAWAVGIVGDTVIDDRVAKTLDHNVRARRGSQIPADKIFSR